MDIYTQIEGKLHDMTRRLTQEAKYFHECGPRDQEASSEGGSEGSRQRYPLLEHSDFRYPHPLLETKDSLAVRAQLSAAALITLNEQVDALLATLPEDEGKEEVQAAMLQELARDNDLAGETLRAEAEGASEMLVQVREALNVMGDGRYKDALDKLRLEMELGARGLAPLHASSSSFDSSLALHHVHE
eukprot:Tamp_34281.p1 GENE.Tamp_34281~~Tamp_34281.p1  ORF type:complete len:188 (-),score=53.45 Tamp_34281:43-606(-)